MPSPSPEHPGLFIRDPYRFSDAMLVIPPPLVECLQCFDGLQTDLDLRAALVSITGRAEVGHPKDSRSPANSLDSFCVARWTDRGRTYPPPLECHKTNDMAPGVGGAGHGLDGSGIAASPRDGAVVIGYHNVGADPTRNQTDDQADLWYTCSSLSNSGSTCGPGLAFKKGTGSYVPFPGKVCVGHPRMAFDAGGLLHVIENIVPPGQGGRTGLQHCASEQGPVVR